MRWKRIPKKYKDYQEFLDSKFWRGLRDDCLRRDEWECKCCGSKNGLQAHHMKYRHRWQATQKGPER